MDKNKRQIFEFLQDQLEGLSDSTAVEAEMLQVIREAGLEQDVAADGELDGTLRLQKHIESSEDAFVDNVMQLVEGKSPSPPVNFSMTELRISGEVQAESTDATKLSAGQEIPQPPVAQRMADSEPVPPPPPVPEIDVFVGDAVQSIEPPIQSIPTKRQYDRVNRQQSRYYLTLTLAISTLLVGAVGIIVLNQWPNQNNGSGPNNGTAAANDNGKNGVGKSFQLRDSLPKKFPSESNVDGMANNPTNKSETKRVDPVTDGNLKVVDNAKKPLREVQSVPKSKDVDKRLQNENSGSMILAKLVESKNAVWDGGSTAYLGGDRQALQSGQLVFRMGNGALVTVTGPAEFELKSTDRMELNSGVLSANVPSQAVGFTVDTPASKVVDLGTEFDVAVDESGATGVRVHKGEVTMEPVVTSDSAKPDSSKDQSSKIKWNLKKGDYKWIDEKGLSHDWNLTLKLDAKGHGAIHINGIRFQLSDKDSFDKAQQRIQAEFQKFEKEFVGRVGNGKAFSGVINMAGTHMDFDDLREFRNARVNAAERLQGLEEIMDKFAPEEIMKRGIRTSSGGFSIGSSSVSKDGIEMGGFKIDKDGIEFDGKAFPGFGGDMMERLRGMGRFADAKNSKWKPGPNELILLVDGAGKKYRLRSVEGKTVSEVKKLKGGREEVEVKVASKQKITLYMEGAGNIVYVPSSLRRNIKTSIAGAENKVEYYKEP